MRFFTRGLCLGKGSYRDNVVYRADSDIVELNIGHAIMARAMFTGLAAAVADMKQLMREARSA
mgnify:CR=1 FL=1